MEAAMFMEAQANSWYNHYQCLDATERLGGATPGTVNSPSKGGSQVTPKKQKAVSIYWFFYICTFIFLTLLVCTSSRILRYTH